MAEVIKIKKTVQADKTLALVFNCFQPKTKRSHSTNYSFKFFTQKILHVFYLFVFICRTFSFHGGSFSFTAMFALFFHLFIHTKFIFDDLVQHPVHNHIWITSNRGSKMTIVFKSQTIMANIFGGIFRLCHSANT